MTRHAIEIDAGQLLIAGFPTADPPTELLRAASRVQLGGFILFKRNLGTMKEVAELNRRLIEAAPDDFPPWIAVDQEGGRVARLGPPVITLPPMRTFGTIDQPTLTHDVAKLLGKQLGLLGFNLDFAPVLDVDTNPANPVIGDRAFGHEPQRVIRHAIAFASGLEQAAVCSCGKHFPGHGDTQTDSHLELPRLNHDLNRLEQIEIAPFKAAVGEIPAIMTAHIVCDAIDADLPATLSRRVVTTLLRERLEYGGIVFSDDMEMKAISDNYCIENAACLAVEAGCDALLYCSRADDLFQAHRALVVKAEREPTFANRLREARERVVLARKRYRPTVTPDTSDIERVLNADNPQAIKTRITRMIS